MLRRHIRRRGRVTTTIFPSFVNVSLSTSSMAGDFKKRNGSATNNRKVVIDIATLETSFYHPAGIAKPGGDQRV